MNVKYTDRFWSELEAELVGDGRPSRADFEKQVMPVVDLTARMLWGDDTVTPLVDDSSGVRYIRWSLIPPHMFPPGHAYGVQVDNETVLIDGLDIDWEYWEVVNESNEADD